MYNVYVYVHVYMRKTLKIFPPQRPTPWRQQCLDVFTSNMSHYLKFLKICPGRRSPRAPSTQPGPGSAYLLTPSQRPCVFRWRFRSLGEYDYELTFDSNNVGLSSHLQDRIYHLHDRCKQDGDAEKIAVTSLLAWTSGEKSR